MVQFVTNYLNNLFNLQGKVAVITGGGGHLCSEIARALAGAGCRVAIFDLRVEKAELIEKALLTEGYVDVFSGQIDVTNRESNLAALELALNRFGNVDVLINGAGINAPTPFLEIELEDWQSVIDSQLTGVFLGCQIFGEYMLKKTKGSIINISSASAGPPLSKAFAYSVAKAGILNLTQNLGREWGVAGVRVNAIRPGFFPTDWNLKNFITPERESSILNHTPMKRFGHPKELAGAVLWLASDASSFVTGSEVAIDGGFGCMTI